MSFSKQGAAVVTATALATVVLAGAGCGKSSKTEPTATTAASATGQPTTQAPTAPSGPEIKLASGKPLPRARWIAKGDAICARANIRRHAQTARTEAEIARLAPQISGSDRLEAVELSKLVPPPAMAAGWRQVVTDAQRLGEFATTVGGYAGQGKFREGQTLMIVAGKLQNELTLIARRDGFKICSVQ